MSKKTVDSSLPLNGNAQDYTFPVNESNQQDVNWNGRGVVPLDQERDQHQPQAAVENVGNRAIEAFPVTHRSNNNISLGRIGFPDDAAIMREISANLDSRATIVLVGCQSGTR